ncbi:MAG: class I SAM-dependent methyltransferase [Candidatus Omnitrophota bacterium]|jgi:SAM-dependent methyltransferase
MSGKRQNFLLEKTIDIFRGVRPGKVLDIGCGDGDYSRRLKDMGFDIIAGDMDEKRFRYHGEIPFKYCDITKSLPFPDNYFDHVLLMEVVEHLRNPYTVLAELARIIKPRGFLVLSTPNILSLKSRFRYLFEGSYDYFREPPLDQVKNSREVIFNLHLVPYRYHELEYLLNESRLRVEGVYTSQYEGYGFCFLLPLIYLQSWQKERRAKKKHSIDYKRINTIVLSRQLLFGRHMIIKAEKQ